ncbi:hypothetical protein [Kitasatospora sp. NPDC087271]|uniref:hypothetical protein n=1 Tax=Kitasatospora sp. NPDC087271 TaxID=3364067 RepID=UPI003813A531
MKHPIGIAAAALTAGTLVGGLLVYDTSAAGVPQVITCEDSFTMTFSSGLTLVPQDNITATLGDPKLLNCTGDAPITQADYVGTGLGNGVTCAAGNYQNAPGTLQRVTWETANGQPTTEDPGTTDFTWDMQPIQDLLKSSNPLSGGITAGRYKGATWTVVLDPVKSDIDLTACSTPTGLKSMTLDGTVTITLPTGTQSPTPTPTSTSSPTSTPTPTATPTVTPTPTATPTPTVTPTARPMPVPFVPAQDA